ncbi:MAG TPA: MFS transporter [Propionibacteriaceae bacterium]|nr:MFS transporter [Propionibacteriaceae bacterium]
MARTPPRTTAGYAIGSVGTGGFGTLPGLVLSYYLTDTLGVAAGMASLVVTVPKIWDVLIDPFIGRLSDGDRRRTGHRARIMLIGAVTLPLCVIALFAAPDSVRGMAAGLWVAVAYVACTTAFSLFQVPYLALPAELSDTYEGRTRLVAPRIAVLTLAILAFGAGGPMVRDAMGGGRAGYLGMAVVTGLLMGVGMVASALLTRTPVTEQSDLPATDAAAGATFSAAMAALRESSPLRALLGTFLLQALATGAMLAAAQYVATYLLRNEGAVTFLFIALVAPAMLVMPLARRLADRIGKRRAYVAATVLFAVAAAALLPAAQLGAATYAVVAVCGVAYAGMQLYPLAMLPDVIAHDEPGRAGVTAGVWTAGETTGMALGPTVALLVLAVTGFVSSDGGTRASQPPSALWGVAAIFSVLPAALALLSLVPLSRYRLGRAEVDA